MSGNDRLDKIRALLDSPNEGERQAAREALSRATAAAAPPKRGTKEYFAAIHEWCAKIEFCVSRLGEPSLTASEIRTVRMMAKHRGTPWDRGSAALLSVFNKLSALEKNIEGIKRLGTA